MSLTQHGSPSVEQTTRDETIEMVADRIQQAGMSGPAAVLLHTFKPLAWAGGQLAWAFQPFIDGLHIGGRSAGTQFSVVSLARLLESEEDFDALLERLRNPGRQDK